jgi:hypothetical protein
MKSKIPSFADTGFSQALYQFVGQSDLPTWNLVGSFGELTWPEYDWLRSHEPELVFARIKQLVMEFPTWQRYAGTGRRPYQEQVILAGILMRGYMRTTFDETESYLRLLGPYLGFNKTPDSKTLSRWNRSRRFRNVLRRFFEYILRPFASKDCTIAVDSTGFSALRQSWRRTPYSHRANGPWVKSHFAVDIKTGLVLSTVTTKSNLHDSQAYADVIDKIPPYFGITRSLADGAYSGNPVLMVAMDRGISPIHTVRSDAKWLLSPDNPFQKLTRFARTFPNRFAELIGPRAFAETTVASVKTRSADRIRCRHPIAKDNEIDANYILQNIRRTIKPSTLQS